MRAFVTGGLGFVGRRLTPRLESADYQIVFGPLPKST